ncbi:MAG: radical SAM protein [Nanoarchaeota archaeon]|nr:radical SAM protein [Nanoarchaeota archaeon]
MIPLYGFFIKKHVPAPEMVNINLRQVCNSKCMMCYNWKKDSRPKEVLSGRRWKEILKDIRSSYRDSRISVSFTGSESLLSPDLPDLIAESERLGFDTWLHTNGYLVTRQAAQTLRSAGLRNISVSVDSILPQEHDLMRGIPGALSKAMAAISHLHDAGLRNININTVICGVNYASLPLLADKIEEDTRLSKHTLQAVSKIFNSSLGDDWYLHCKELWPQDPEDVARVISSIDEKRGRKLVNPRSQLKAFSRYFRNPETSIRHLGCSVGARVVNIGPDGNVSICPEMVSGFVSEMPFHKVWNSKENRAVLKSMDSCAINCHALVNCAYTD